MAELVPALFSAVAAAGSAASTAASAVGGAAASFGSFLSSSGILTGLQAGTGLLAIAAKNRASQEQKEASFDKAAEAEIDARAEGVAGQTRAVQLRRQMVDAMAERDIAAAAGGLDIGFGSPVQAREQVASDAERALSIDALETANRQSRLRERSASYIRAGRAARQGGLLDMFATGLNTATDIATRGVTPASKPVPKRKAA